MLRALPNAPAAFEVTPTADGFLVRLPMTPACGGCMHHVVRVPLHVSRSGCITRVRDPLVPLAWHHAFCAW